MRFVALYKIIGVITFLLVATPSAGQQTPTKIDPAEKKPIEQTKKSPNQIAEAVTYINKAKQDPIKLPESPVTTVVTNDKPATKVTAPIVPKSNERFVPTEEISEDLAVSFPIDI